MRFIIVPENLKTRKPQLKDPPGVLGLRSITSRKNLIDLSRV